MLASMIVVILSSFNIAKTCWLGNSWCNSYPIYTSLLSQNKNLLVVTPADQAGQKNESRVELRGRNCFNTKFKFDFGGRGGK